MYWLLTMAKQGSKHVQIIGKDDKQQSPKGMMSGDFLPGVQRDTDFCYSNFQMTGT